MSEISKERVEALASNILECHDVKPSEVKALAVLALLALRKEREAAVSDGYCVMPCKLSAENGAKVALSGEFHVAHYIVCQSCGGEGCEDCNEEGGWDCEILIGWDIIKRIYEAAVGACALPPTQSTNPCPKCGDTGLADSGGMQPWGEPILIECDCTTPPAQPVAVPDEVLKRLLPDAEKSEFWFEHNGKIFFEGVKFNDAVFKACRAAMLQGAEPVSQNDELPLDYLQGHKDGLEWAAQLAEANHPQTGDWLYDDPTELAKAIRKGPDIHELKSVSADEDDNFYSWFGRFWHENYQQKNYTTSAKQTLGTLAEFAYRAGRDSAIQDGNSPATPDCWCRTCRPVTMSDMRFVVCPDCGNKRCPHANDHRNACTGSNEPGQDGSEYPAAPGKEG